MNRSWKSAVDALASVGIHGNQFRTLLADSPGKLYEPEEESERKVAACDDTTDFPVLAQPKRSQIVDLIALLHEDKITLNEADDTICNATAQIPVVEADPERWAAPLGLSRHEARTITHVAGRDGVMLFRYQGWPTFCADCNLLLDYETDDWRCDVDNDGKFCLLHTDCWLVLQPHIDKIGFLRR